jgi:hypothetical protein
MLADVCRSLQGQQRQGVFVPPGLPTSKGCTCVGANHPVNRKGQAQEPTTQMTQHSTARLGGCYMMEGRVVGRGRPSERVSLLHRGLAGVLISGVVRRVRHAPDAIRRSWAHCDDSDCSKPSVLVLLLCGFSVSWVGAVSNVLLVGCLWVPFQEARLWQRHMVLQERWYWFACLRCWLIVWLAVWKSARGRSKGCAA